jgi:hypothetical protein
MAVGGPAAGMQLVFSDDFDGAELDRSVWLPHYLPAWSSLAATAASYQIADSCLRLYIPPEQGLWLPGEHSPLRVSAIQSGNWSGPVGGTRGQQPWRDGVLVRQQQEAFAGWTPRYGYLEMRARAVLTPRSMVAWWLAGLEDSPERCAEITVHEIFGDAVQPGLSTVVGMGLHAFRDPAVTEDWAAVPLPIDPTGFHVYAVDWTAERADFYLDGELVRSAAKPPDYPMQHEITVFDFPDRSDGTDDAAVPELVVDWIRGYER